MISFVIPVYRSAGSLPELVRRITQQFGTDTDGIEIIFVEDCGGDNSWQIIELLASKDQRIRGLRLTRNYGQHNALLCGIRAAQGEVIVTLDDDLQHPPEEIPKLLAKLAEGHDVVYGPPEHEPHGLARGLASQLFKLALRGTLGAKNAQQVSALRVFKTRLRNAFTNYLDPTVNIDVLLTWGTTRFSAVKVRHDVRTLGESGYTTRKLVHHAMNMMTGFSVRPLQLASMIGFIFSILGLAILVYVLTLWAIRGSEVPGFVFLASIIAIFSGAQLLALGIIGEYLARMHMRAQERPPYIVCEELNVSRT
ncbi:glycosyltransferase family 2 protein [Alcaligenaceae bacterium LF4-65]|uniref:Glycosyltransferase family 2 protein n=1 Tax=Zwartia hollandica TaxID=324606 RepID=A0A953N8U0_9BURK|nr:glycosyltransferase family 2 protein [Zwartia hollandica]MBZ1350128.1 glycosyltransferase family 2 protein [Zwartia hollandica]